MHFLTYGQFVYFVFFGVFSLVCFELSIPVQKNNCLAGLIYEMTEEQDVKLLTHSLTVKLKFT